MALITFSDIPRSALARLLDHVGKANGISPRPLMGKPCSFDAHQLSELYAGGFIRLPKGQHITLTPQFVRVAKVLLNPHTNVTLRVWGQDNICGETNIQFPEDIIQGDGVILNQIGGYYRISAFIKESDVSELISKALPAGRETDIDFEFDGHFDSAVIAVFFAALDLVRNQIKTEAKPTANTTAVVFSTQQVHDYMFERWGFTGFNDLVTYVGPVGMMAEPPSLSQTVDGVRSLVKAGILKETKTDHFNFALVMEPLINLTLGLQAGVQWQRISLMESGELLVSNRIYVFGDKSFTLCLTPTVKGKVFVSRVRHKEMVDFFLDEITAALTPPLVSTPVIKQEAATVQLTCPRCGQPLSPGAQFCKKCGTSIITKTESGSINTCPSCGQVLNPGARFCPKCGEAV